MHTPEKENYPTFILTEVFLSFLKVKHFANEDLVDYPSWFKTEIGIVIRLLGGDRLIDGYMELLPGYISATDDDGRKAVKNKDWDKLMAVLFLGNARHGRFGDLLVD